ncbi:hypothetical protein D3C87_1954930 [compost metagenome]
MQHHLGGLVQIHVEELLQDVHDEIHRGVVVIEQHDLIEGRRRHFRARGLHGNAVLVVGIGGGLARHLPIIRGATALRRPRAEWTARTPAVTIAPSHTLGFTGSS